MKNKIIYRFLILAVITVFAFTACEDKNDLTAPAAPNTGSADFSRLVSIGNSLTAGYQSSSLFESAQNYSYGNMIAKQVGTTYAQPIFSDPGTPGRMELTGFTDDGLPIITENTNSGAPTNLTYAAPYNNLGVPGAWLADALYATDKATSIGKVELFDAILRNLGTQIHQTMMQQPTFVTFWLGNNDILGYAAKGGTVPHNDANTFAFLYSAIMDSLAATGASVVVANIPAVTGAPYFSTAGPVIGLAIKPAVDAGLAVGMFYNKNGESGPTPPTQFATYGDLLAGNIKVTLPASSFAQYIGTAFDFYTATGQSVPAGIDVTKPFGLHPQNPMPDVFVLDADEITEVQNTIAAFNASIKTLAEAKGFGVVDVYSLFSELTASGKVVNGIKFTTSYITGNTFSLDGVHPSSQGYGVVANEFIKTINAKFGASIPLIDVSTIPGSLELGKKIEFNKLGLPKIDFHAFDNILF